MVWLLLAAVALAVVLSRTRLSAQMPANRRFVQSGDRVLRLFGAIVLMVGAAVISLMRFFLRLDWPRW